MRLLHISDWHLGRMTYRHSRAPDHDAVLEETIGYAEALRPHLIVHTGDVFDGFRPGYEEMRRGIDALQALAAIAPVVVLAGNHDSPALFRLFNRLQG
jgi:exonuclease SbcD